MNDPLAVQLQQAFQSFRVRLLTGDAFRDATGLYDYDILIESQEWGQLCAASDRYAKAEGLPPFGPGAAP